MKLIIQFVSLHLDQQTTYILHWSFDDCCITVFHLSYWDVLCNLQQLYNKHAGLQNKICQMYTIFILPQLPDILFIL